MGDSAATRSGAATRFIIVKDPDTGECLPGESASWWVRGCSGGRDELGFDAGATETGLVLHAPVRAFP